MISNCSQTLWRSKSGNCWHLREPGPLFSLGIPEVAGLRGSGAFNRGHLYGRTPGDRTAVRMHPSQPPGNSSSSFSLGTHSCPFQPQRGQFPTSEKQSRPLNGKLASKEAAGLGKQKTKPQAKTKQEGAWKSFILRSHSLPKPIFLI